MGQFGIGINNSNQHYLMFNEGGRYFNFTIIRYRAGNWFWYLYLFGKRWHN